MKRISIFFVVLSMFISSSFVTVHAASGFVSRLCASGNYRCIRVGSRDSWQSLFRSHFQRDVVKRINRINTPLRAGMTIAIPRGGASHHMHHSPFNKRISSDGRKTIVFDPKLLAFGAYNEKGQLVHWGPASGGAGYCADVGRRCRTTTGTYTIYHKKGAWCESSKYPLGGGGAPMPFCMFFNGGYAIHGSYHVPGYNASHGCIRVFTSDAEWLNHEFISLPGKSRKGTRVIIRPYA